MQWYFEVYCWLPLLTILRYFFQHRHLITTLILSLLVLAVVITVGVTITQRDYQRAYWSVIAAGMTITTRWRQSWQNRRRRRKHDRVVRPANGVARKCGWGPLHFPLPCPHLLPSSSPSPPLRSRPHIAAKGSEGALKLPQRVRAEPNGFLCILNIILTENG